VAQPWDFRLIALSRSGILLPQMHSLLCTVWLLNPSLDLTSERTPGAWRVPDKLFSDVSIKQEEKWETVKW